MKNRNFLFLAATSLLGLASCVAKPTPSVAPASSEEEVIDTSNMVPVFVMAGQSNMQGNTRITPMYGGNTNYLKNWCTANEKDYNKFNTTGFEFIQHSYYGYYPYGGSINPYTSSTGSDILAGKFVNTKAGQGLNNSCIGPELGIADVLEEHANEDKPIYLIKDAKTAVMDTADARFGDVWMKNVAAVNGGKGALAPAAIPAEEKMKQ